MDWISAEFFLKRVVCLLKMSTSLDAWLAAETHLVGRVTASSCKQGADKTKYMIMSRDQNAGRSYSMKIDNSSIERETQT
jgi:hypothetical protein